MLNTQYRNLSELRLVFALCVVVAHAIQLAEFHRYDYLRLVFSSETAVQAFFILSGFLVVNSYERSTNLWDFYRRRFMRIYPAYFVAVVFFMLLGLVQGNLFGFDISVQEVTQYLVANLSLLNFLKPDIAGVFERNAYAELNGALWTIKVEVGFYLLVPAIFWMGRRWTFSMAAALLIAVGVTWRWGLEALTRLFGIPIHDALFHQLPGQLQFFGLGVLLYYISKHPQKLRQAIGIVVMAALVSLLVDQFHMAIQIVFLCGLIFAVIRLPQFKSPLGGQDISYGVYLCHFPIIQLLVNYREWPGMEIVFMTVLLIFVLAYALLSWKIIERPAIAVARSKVA